MDLIFGTDYQGLMRFEVMTKSQKNEVRNKIMLAIANGIISDLDKISSRQIKTAKTIKFALNVMDPEAKIELDWSVFNDTDWNNAEDIAKCIKHFTTEEYRGNESLDKWLLRPYIISIEGVNVI